MNPASTYTPSRPDEYIWRFQAKGAVDQEHAMSLKELGCRETTDFWRMANAGVFVPCPHERFFLEESTLPAYEAGAQKANIFGVVLIVFELLMAFF